MAVSLLIYQLSPAAGSSVGYISRASRIRSYAGPAQQLDGADAASPAFGFGAILAFGWPGGSSRGR